MEGETSTGAERRSAGDGDDLVWPPPDVDLEAVVVVAVARPTANAERSAATSAAHTPLAPLPTVTAADAADQMSYIDIVPSAADLDAFGEEGDAPDRTRRHRRRSRRWRPVLGAVAALVVMTMAGLAVGGLAGHGPLAGWSALTRMTAERQPVDRSTSAPAPAATSGAARVDQAASQPQPARPLATEPPPPAALRSAPLSPASPAASSTADRPERPEPVAPPVADAAAAVVARRTTPPLSQRGTAAVADASSGTGGALPSTTSVSTVDAAPPSASARLARGLPATALGTTAPMPVLPLREDVPLPATNHVAPIPTPSAAALPGAATPRPDQSQIRAVLGQYASAYGNLDAGAAQAVWPSVDARALRRAFSGLESQSLEFSACDFDIGVGLASAQCRGQATYVPRVGSKAPRTVSRTWAFQLRKADDGWLIVDAAAR